MSTPNLPAWTPGWYSLPADEVALAFGTDPQDGLTASAVASARRRYGPNELPAAPSATAWQIAGRQWREPMTAMLTVVALVSAVIGQEETAILVGLLVALNIAMGTQQTLKAQSSTGALAELQVPLARVVRDGATEEVPAGDLVPGDVVAVEAGDMVPADGRLLSSAALEVAESALTGESSPVAKDPAVVAERDPALGDRTNMLFQNTSITRGRATMVVTATGSNTQMGVIADMLNTVEAGPSPLQRELRRLTVRLAVVAWAAVALIVALGFARGLGTDAVVLLGVTTAISAIPSGLPTFLTAMLAYGAQRLAHAKAVVKSLSDVEALGAINAINSDKTGTLTLDMMTATRMYAFGQWFAVGGTGYAKEGEIRHAAGKPEPDFEPLGYGLALCGDAEVSDDGAVVGDPTEAALVVLAAKMGVDAAITRREYPRVAEVPFDSAYKFMATFHRAELDGADTLMELVKGAPDVVLDRCRSVYDGHDVVPLDRERERILAANEELAREGLRVMSFAIREFPPETDVTSDPMTAVADLTFVALVGIIDPLRPSAKDAVAAAREAGIDVRMITGDHAITAGAIAADLGLGEGVITGPQFQQLSDDQLLERLDDLHVFGRVAPEDKLRLVAVMQERGDLVAMTGDAVNDAAALKKADVGVAMGSGSAVSRQSANMILTDNNFATLVQAIELGRDIFDKITAQIRYVLAGLFGLLGLMLLASLLNLNDGAILSPVQLLFVSFLIGLFPAMAISTDSPEPGTMQRPPRDRSVPILNPRTAAMWVAFGAVQASVSAVPFLRQGHISVPEAQTMSFAILAASTVWMAAALRRDVTPVWAGPFMPYWLWLLIPAALIVLAVEAPFLQQMLGTVSLNGAQWEAVSLLSLVVPLIIEVTKWFRRNGTH